MGVGHVPTGEVCKERQGDDLPRRQYRRAGADLRSLSRRRLGRLGESIAADFLERRGAVIQDRNLRVGRGELDLLVSIDGERAAVEVKTGAAESVGDPTDHFDQDKQQQVRKLAQSVGVYRVDFVGIEVTSLGVSVRWLPRVC